VAEHFSLLLGTHSLANAFPRHFGSLEALCKELRQFLSRSEAEMVRRRFGLALLLRQTRLYGSPLHSKINLRRAFCDFSPIIVGCGATSRLLCGASQRDRIGCSIPAYFGRSAASAGLVKIFAQDHDLPGTIVSACRRRNSNHKPFTEEGHSGQRNISAPGVARNAGRYSFLRAREKCALKDSPLFRYFPMLQDLGPWE
jgi:hypothetical protein